jgi:hypothetical protein
MSASIHVESRTEESRYVNYPLFFNGYDTKAIFSGEESLVEFPRKVESGEAILLESGKKVNWDVRASDIIVGTVEDGRGRLHLSPPFPVSDF